MPGNTVRGFAVLSRAVWWYQHGKPYMFARVAISSLTVGLLAVVGWAASGGMTWAAVAAGAVEFQDGAGNTRAWVEPDETVFVYVSDAGLGTTQIGAATWSELPARVPANTWWNIATGAPHPAVYALGPETSYDRDIPSMTPIASVDTVSVDGVAYLPGYLDATAGKFTLLNDVSTSSSVVIGFTFDVVDVIPADQHRVRVISTSDAVGEWTAVSEVASETDPSASPVSGVFRGVIALSVDGAAIEPGDGAVRARQGDTLTLTYFQADGVTPISSHSVSVVSTSAAEVPTGGWIALSVLAGALALAGLTRMRGISVRPR